MKYTSTIILFFILIVGFFLRFWGADKNPSILNRDEAALGYNAFLLKELGVDEWNRPWPLALESFGDYKLVGYPAVLSVFFSLFGMSDLVVRLPSILAGTILIVIAYTYTQFLKMDSSFSLLAALSIAVAPFALFYSKMAYEANLALALFSASVLLLFSNSTLIRTILGILCMLLAVITYNTPLLLIPLVMIILILYRGIANWKEWLLPVTMSLVIFGAMVIQLQPLTDQKSSITIFNDELSREQSINYRLGLPTPLQPILGNKYIFFLGRIVQNSIKSFSPKFLVIEGGQHPWHSLPDWGHIYSLTYLFALVGIVITTIQAAGRVFYLFYNKKFNNVYDSSLAGSFAGKRVTLLLLLIISLAPSVVTIDSPHATRSLYFLFLLHIFAMLGLYDCVVLLHNRFRTKDLWKKLEGQLLPLYSLTLIFFVCLYMYEYVSVYPQKQTVILKSGFDRVLEQVVQENSETEVAIVDEEGYHYILTAWYLKIEPEKYLETVVRQLPNQIGFRYGQQVDNFHFIAHKSDRSEKEKTLVYFDGTMWKFEKF